MSQTFSTKEQCQTSIDFLSQLKPVTCTGCQRGVSMCNHTPCLGTVDDIERLIDAGYAKNLMLDFYYSGSGDFDEDVAYLCPAIIGMEGKQAPFARHGTCNLLVNGMCSIHHIKPIQGKLACCKIERYYEATFPAKEVDERIPVLHTWNTQRGKDLIARWAMEVNYQGEFAMDRNNLSLGDMMELLFKVMSSKDKQYEVAEQHPIDPNEIEKQFYKNPY